MSLPRVAKNKTDDESTTFIPVNDMTLWDYLEGCTRLGLSYDEQGSWMGQK